MIMNGKVTLVGAGPGDAGLLTLKGLQALQQADVVVHDRLIGVDLLDLIPASAECINVGKESSHHLVPQDEINQILLDKAQEGKNVVRLKGGDNFLFGRGGEELEALRESEIPFEVVPGVTSALAVPAYAGIPVTHRDFASSVHIITGHTKKHGEWKLDYEALVRHQGTLVFLMSVTNAPRILQGLMEAGMTEDMPAAIVENGTLPAQRKLIATVGTLAQRMQEERIHAPAVLIVGGVCTLSENFDWISGRPLSGKRILVTRPKARAGTLSRRLEELGADVVSYPCIDTEEIWPNDEAVRAIDSLPRYSWLVLTSPTGVDALFSLLDRMELDARALSLLKIAVIGKGTADRLKEYSIRADFMPKVYDSMHLANGLFYRVRESERLLLMRADIASDDLPRELDRAVIFYDDIPLYRTVFAAERSWEIAEQIRSGSIDWVTFTSESTVQGFVGSLPDVDITGLRALCIGKRTAHAAQQLGMRVTVAKNATIDDMIAALLAVTDEPEEEKPAETPEQPEVEKTSEQGTEEEPKPEEIPSSETSDESEETPEPMADTEEKTPEEPENTTSDDIVSEESEEEDDAEPLPAEILKDTPDEE